MKTQIKYLLSIFFILASNLVLGQAIITLDTVEISAYNVPNWPKSERVNDTLNFSINSIDDHDTLILKTEVNCHGEFGGHLEYIYVFKIANSYFIKWTNYHSETGCNPNWRPGNLQIKYNNGVDEFISKEITVKINESGLLLIQNYLNDFENFIPEKCISNAPFRVWVSYKESTYTFKDPCGNWTKFEELKNALFDQFN